MPDNTNCFHSFIYKNPTWSEIYFDWTHETPVLEPIVSKNKYINDWNKNNWEVIKEYSCQDLKDEYSKFNSIYTWLILKKK